MLTFIASSVRAGISFNLFESKGYNSLIFQNIVN